MSCISMNFPKWLTWIAEWMSSDLTIKTPTRSRMRLIEPMFTFSKSPMETLEQYVSSAES